MVEVLLTKGFVAWLDRLDDTRARMRIVARIRHIETGNLGDWRPVAGHISELRIHHGPGYRLYFIRRGGAIVILLAGGTKTTQKRDVRRAVALAAILGEEP